MVSLDQLFNQIADPLIGKLGFPDGPPGGPKVLEFMRLARDEAKGLAKGEWGC